MSNFHQFDDHLMIGIAQTEARRFVRARESFERAYEIALIDQRVPNLILLLEHLASLVWLQNQDPGCVVDFSAVAVKRASLNLAPEFPIGFLVEETLIEMRGVMAANEFEVLWEEGQNRDPAKRLQELLQTKNRA